MKRVAAILSVFTAFILVTSYAVSWAGVELEAPAIANPPEEWLGEPETFPLIPVPEDPNALPKEIKEFLEGSFAIFDMSIVGGDLMGYPFPHAKVSFLVRGKAVVVMTLFLGSDDFEVPDPDENSILEVKWFSTDPDNVNSPSLRMKPWINYPLIKKIAEELMGEKPNEKITT